MARKPNYSFERQERERAAALKAAEKAAAKAERKAEADDRQRRKPAMPRLGVDKEGCNRIERLVGRSRRYAGLVDDYAAGGGDAADELGAAGFDTAKEDGLGRHGRLPFGCDEGSRD